DYDIQFVHGDRPISERGNIGDAIRELHEAVRTHFGVEPGTAFDTNAYDGGEAMARLSGAAPDFVGHSAASQQARAQSAHLQDIASLAMVRVQMGPHGDGDFRAYIAGIIEGLPAEQQGSMRQRGEEALAEYDRRQAAIDRRIARIQAAEGEGAHRSPADLEMRATNELYAD